MKKVYWKGYHRQTRMAGLPAMEAAINRTAFIIDFKPYSDVGLSLVIEVAAHKADALYAELAGLLLMDAHEPLGTASTQDMLVYLHLTFAGGTGNLTHDVPAVPG
jgi:hypothetical protein